MQSISKKHTEVLLKDKLVKLRIKINPRAQRIILKPNHLNNSIELVMPKFTKISDGLEFLNANKNWLINQFNNAPTPIPFKEGSIILFLGNNYEIKYTPELFSRVWTTKNTIHVSGKIDQISSLIKSWLKNNAQCTIDKKAKNISYKLNKKIKKISLRDTKTRWGSCGQNGKLSFSWRLIFAPPPILDYVVVHEVCHLAEMNHGKNFWELVDTFHPNKKFAQNWLKKNGDRLLLFGNEI